MDKIVIEKKVDSILRCLNRIEQRLPESEEAFMQDYDAQDVVVLNLTRAVQMSVDIAMHLLASSNQAVPATMAEAFEKLFKMGIISPNTADKMRRSVGYRNIAIHSYDEVDLSITYSIAQKHLGDFKEFIKQIL